jgi:hypothetical protein
METIDQGDAQGLIRHLHLYVPSDLHERVEKAATAAGVNIAPWLRHIVRQIAITDFPVSWQAERSEERSHDSRDYDTRFMLRLDETSRKKLQDLVERFAVSKARIIRRLITQASDGNFPKSWHMRAVERRARQAEGHGTGKAQDPRR